MRAMPQPRFREELGDQEVDLGASRRVGGRGREFVVAGNGPVRNSWMGMEM